MSFEKVFFLNEKFNRFQFHINSWFSSATELGGKKVLSSFSKWKSKFPFSEEEWKEGRAWVVGCGNSLLIFSDRFYFSLLDELSQCCCNTDRNDWFCFPTRNNENRMGKICWTFFHSPGKNHYNRVQFFFYILCFPIGWRVQGTGKKPEVLCHRSL